MLVSVRCSGLSLLPFPFAPQRLGQLPRHLRKAESRAPPQSCWNSFYVWSCSLRVYKRHQGEWASPFLPGCVLCAWLALCHGSPPHTDQDSHTDNLTPMARVQAGTEQAGPCPAVTPQARLLTSSCLPWFGGPFCTSAQPSFILQSFLSFHEIFKSILNEIECN